MAKKPTPKKASKSAAAVKAAADKAEKTAAAKAAKSAKAEPAAAAPKPEPKKFNAINAEEKALFLRHRPGIEAQLKKVNTAVSDLRKLYKTAKAEGGFTKADFDYARALENAEAEAKTRAKIARNLLIAKYMGSDLGAQLDLFLEPSRVDSSERATEEGQRDSMEGKSAKPSYDPSTAQYRAYMTAYNDDQERRIKGGIKKLDPETHPEVIADEAKKAETTLITKAQKDADAAAFEAANTPAPTPQSGVPMTRSEFNAKRAAANPRDAAESHFKKTVN